MCALAVMDQTYCVAIDKFLNIPERFPIAQVLAPACLEVLQLQTPKSYPVLTSTELGCSMIFCVLATIFAA